MFAFFAVLFAAAVVLTCLQRLVAKTEVEVPTLDVAPPFAIPFGKLEPTHLLVPCRDGKHRWVQIVDKQPNCITVKASGQLWILARAKADKLPKKCI
jgi:hypothetical protein